MVREFLDTKIGRPQAGIILLERMAAELFQEVCPPALPTVVSHSPRPLQIKRPTPDAGLSPSDHPKTVHVGEGFEVNVSQSRFPRHTVDHGTNFGDLAQPPQMFGRFYGGHDPNVGKWRI
jgi:hypothetical protein